MSDLPNITDKQNAFVKEYILNGNNATEAYRIAYNSNGSTATCCVEGSRLLKNPNISLWLEHLQQTMQAHIENEIKYTIDDAFKECEELKIIALESRDQYGRPNVGAANKAVEMKCKLKGLLSGDAQISNQVVVKMNDVEIDGKTLELNIGEEVQNEIETSENS